MRFGRVLSHLTTVLFTFIFAVCGIAQLPVSNAEPADSLHYSVEKSADTTKTDTLKLGELPVSPDALDSKVDYTARDSIRFDLQEKKIYLFGEADVKYDKIHLTADYIIIDWETNIVHAEGRPDSTGKVIGDPVFEDGSQSFSTKSIDFNAKSKRGRITDIYTKQGEGFLLGEKVFKNEKDEFLVKNGRFTTCNIPDHPHFFIQASKIKVIPDDKIVTGPANLWIEDVPTPLAVPFGIFPNTTSRQSGVMFPTYGESPGRGFFLMDGGYYFGINEYFDASIRGDIFSRGGWGLKAGTSYNYKYHYNGVLDVRYAKILQGDPELVGSTVNKDFFITWKHNQDAKARPNSRFSASVNAGSNNYNQLNSLNVNNIVANTFQSSISYSKTFANTPFNLSLSAGHSQNTSTRIISITAPEVQVNMNRIFPFKRKNPIGDGNWYQKLGEKIGVNATLQGRNTVSLADSLYRRPGLVDRFTNGVQFQAPISASYVVLKYFTLTVSGNVLGRGYFSSIRKYFDPVTQQLETDTIRDFKDLWEVSGGANMSTRVYSFLKLGKNTIRHVMTPQLSFRIQPDYSTRIYGFYGPNLTSGFYSPYEQGLYGQPSVGRQGTFSVNVNNNLEAKLRSKRDTTGTGLKKVVLLEVFNIGTGYNLAADSLNWQNVAINMRTKLFKKVDLQYNSSYDLYAVDTSNRRINTFEFNKSGKLARMANSYFMITTVIASGQPINNPSTKGTPEQRDEINRNMNSYVDFNIPWSLNANYTLRRSNIGTEIENTQTLQFSGDISVTEKWKVALSSGYDFTNKEFSLTSIDIFRDLHCWEMHFNWIPFTARQSYNFTINVKASMLQELRLNRRRQWFDLTE